MARQARIKIEGLYDVKRQLRQFDKFLFEEEHAQIKEAALEAATVVADEAKGLVPIRSGRLQRSIKPQATGGGKSRVRAGSKVRVPYAGPIHFGVPRPFGRPANIKPNPFLYNAADRRVAEVRAAYDKNIKQLIQKLNLD